MNTASGITDGSIVFEFGTDDYGNPPTGSFYRCFNFLTFADGAWTLYSHYTKLAITRVAATTVSAATLDLSRRVFTRDVPMP